MLRLRSASESEELWLLEELELSEECFLFFFLSFLDNFEGTLLTLLTLEL